MVTDISSRLLVTPEGEKAQKGALKKGLLALAVLTVTVGLVCLAVPSHSRHADITGVTNLDGVTVVQNMLAAWGRGDFNGQGARLEAAKYVAQDTWFKSTYDFKNTDLWNPYTGVDGFVSLCQKQATLYEDKECIVSLTPGAPGSGEVLMMMKWKLAVKSTDRTNSEPFNDFFFITVQDGKIRSTEYYPERGDELDGLFVREDPVVVVKNMFAAWGKGAFNGHSASVEAAKYFAHDMTFKSTCDFKNTDIWKPYSGPDGFVSWCKKQPTVFEIKELTPSIYPGAPGSEEVMMMLKIKVAAKNTGKANRELFNDFTVFTVKDGKITSMEYYPERADELDALFVKEDPVALVQNMFAAWGKGDFNGHSASVEAAKYIAHDMSFKSTCDFKNTDIWKPYSGVDGFVSWCKKQPTVFEIKELTPSIYPGAPGSGEVMMMIQNKIAAKNTGKTNSELFNDFFVVTVKDDKVSLMEYYPERADELDALFVKEDPVAVVQNMFAAWGKGDFNGQSASAEAAKYIARDMSFKSTCDFKNTDIFKPYSGVDGFVSWCKKQPTVFEIKELIPSIYPGAPGSGEVMMMMKTKATAKNTGKTNSEFFNDFSVVTVKDGKIASMEYYPEHGDELDALFVKEDPVALVQNMFAAWGKGDFNGQSASVEAAKYIAHDMTFKSTCDFKNTDIFKPYSGVDGFVSSCKKQPTVLEIKELIPSIYPGAPGSGEVMMMMKTKIVAKNTGKTNSELFNDFFVVTVTDGKIASMEYYPERGVELDGLFVSK